jgi:hypothetical protein
MKYKVTTTASALWHITVEADSMEDAKDKVLDGEYDPKYDRVASYQDEEILAVSLVME